MAAPTNTQIKNAIAQQLSGWDLTAGVRTALNTLIGERSQMQKLAADGAAATATALLCTHRCATAMRVVGARLIPHDVLTANDTNNATISLQRVDGAGGAAVTLASLTTNVAAGNWVANVLQTLTLAASVDVPAGHLLGFAISKAGSGVVVPAFRLIVDLTVGEGL